jgi:hypothetical protein
MKLHVFAKRFAALLADKLNGLRPKRSARPARTLVKSRPASLEQRYLLVEEVDLADEVFRRLQRRVFEAIDRYRDAGGTVFREAGRIAPGRPYFYVKPQSAAGWLFERSGAGWLVTPAEKIVARDLFLRDDQPLDAVQLYMAKDRVVMPRVRSASGGNDLLALAVYEGRLLQQLGLS